VNAAVAWIDLQARNTSTLRWHDVDIVYDLAAQERFGLSAGIIADCMTKASDTYRGNRKHQAASKQINSIA